jgi:Cu/Ag efflux pump CusA
MVTENNREGTMNSSTRRGLVTCASTLAFAAAFGLAAPQGHAAAVSAPAAGPDAPAAVAEITVTAEKRGEKTLDVPMSLTALSGEALVRSGHRRLRPVLMTSLAAAFGMLPLAYGIGSGADMLKPLAIAVIGALCISVLLSLIATPTVYYLLRYRKAKTT